jgi:membrane dipeptidase
MEVRTMRPRSHRSPAILALLGPLLLTLACGPGEPPPPAPPAAAPQAAAAAEARSGGPVSEEAQRLARDLILVDTHIDVPDRLKRKMEDISVRTPEGDFDYPRARAGGLDTAFMSIYVPATAQTDGTARAQADHLIDMVEGFAAQWGDKFALVTSVEDAHAVAGTERIGLAMGMENGAPIGDDLSGVEHFHARGVRYITLTHSKNNQICDSSYDKVPKWNGLSPFGREVVAAMNRLGIMVDISHVSDNTFRQVAEISKAPLIASHSSCRRFTPGWERNMDDDMIRTLAAGGGVIQINFGSAFLTEAAYRQSREYFAAFDALTADGGISPESPEAKAFRDTWWKEHVRLYADVGDVVDHMDHVIQLVGPDHVGLGSDFDGLGDSLPTGLKDVSYFPSLIQAMLDRGYSHEVIGKICGGNILRVWSQVEEIAEELGS